MLATPQSAVLGLHTVGCTMHRLRFSKTIQSSLAVLVLVSLSGIAAAQTPPDDPPQPPAEPAPPPTAAPPPPASYPPPSNYPAPGAYAPPQPGMYPQPGIMAVAPRHEHMGFYLRLMLGGGYSQMTPSGSTDLKVHGSGPGLDINLGYFVTPNFAIGADLWGSGIAQPTVTLNGMDLPSDSSAQLTFAGVGAGATYFVPGPNMFVSASLGFAQATVQSNSMAQKQSPQGWGVHLLAGKEWWVSPHWGIGAALDFFRMSFPDSSDGSNNITDTVYGGGLLFSSSYSGGR
jgi:hypothetical protein